MGQVVSLNNNGVSYLIHQLNDLYHEGKVEGLVLGIKLKDEEFVCGFSNTISYLEKLGLAQAIISDVNLLANEEGDE